LQQLESGLQRADQNHKKQLYLNMNFMETFKISALVIVVVLSATVIYGNTKKGGQIFTAAPAQAVIGISDVLTADEETNPTYLVGSTAQYICTFVTTPNAPTYIVGQSIPREHIRAIIHSYNP
jgi:hypothetical protein